MSKRHIPGREKKKVAKKNKKPIMVSYLFSSVPPEVIEKKRRKLEE